MRQAGGIMLDTPSGHFLSREQSYRDWVVNAFQWTRRKGLKAVVIATTPNSKTQFDEHTRRYLAFLREHNVTPDIIVSEHYTAKPPKDYPNRVGNEDEPDTTLAVAWMLLKSEQSAESRRVKLFESGGNPPIIGGQGRRAGH